MSRSGNFAVGATPSLMLTGQRENSQDPRTFKANGLNQQIIPSSNGMSAQDAKRMTPNGELPDANGMASDTYSQLTPSISMKLNI
jgi:hypothetical protein